MQSVLLGLMIGAAVATPAAGKTFSAASFSASAHVALDGGRAGRGDGGVRIHRLIGNVQGFDRHRRHSDRALGYIYPPDYFQSDYDINRSWDEDSFNDWWHDRADRAYPRWVWHNRDCSEDRMWWSGAGWRCTP